MVLCTHAIDSVQVRINGAIGRLYPFAPPRSPTLYCFADVLSHMLEIGGSLRLPRPRGIVELPFRGYNANYEVDLGELVKIAAKKDVP